MTNEEYFHTRLTELLVSEIANQGLSASEREAIMNAPNHDSKPLKLRKREWEEIFKARKLVETDPEKAWQLAGISALPKAHPGDTSERTSWADRLEELKSIIHERDREAFELQMWTTSGRFLVTDFQISGPSRWPEEPEEFRKAALEHREGKRRRRIKSGALPA